MTRIVAILGLVGGLILLAAGVYAGYVANQGTALIIQSTTMEGTIRGNNTGTINTNGNSAQFAGDNSGTLSISAAGSLTRGNNAGTMTVSGEGAAVLGAFAGSTIVTNAAAGAMILGNLTTGQKAYVAPVANGAILIGAGTVTNPNAIVVGDGNVSHGNASITADKVVAVGSGFVGNGAALTNVPLNPVSSQTVATLVSESAILDQQVSLAMVAPPLMVNSELVDPLLCVYVATNGNDANSGKYSTKPVSNIQHAIDICAAGGTVVLDRGTYYLTNTINVTNGITLIGRLTPKYQVLVGDGTNRCILLNTGTVENLSLTAGFDNGDGGAGVKIVGDGSILRNCRIFKNHAIGAARGGGIKVTAPNALVENCYVFSNSCTSYGGGIGIVVPGDGTMIVRNCLVFTNLAGLQGGGIYAEGTGSGYPTLEINECTVTRNNASNYVGGIGFFFHPMGFNSLFTIRNTISWDNQQTAYGGGADTNVYFWGRFNMNSRMFFGCSSPLEEGENNIADNPLFTDTMRLKAASPCVNAGTNADNMAETDIENSTHLRIINGHVDMGCYESLY